MAELPMVEERDERCETCRFWKKRRTDEELHPDDWPGTCRRYPPVLNLEAVRCSLEGDCDSVEAVEQGHAWEMWVLPCTTASEWCGEWAAQTKPPQG